MTRDDAEPRGTGCSPSKERVEDQGPRLLQETASASSLLQRTRGPEIKPQIYTSYATLLAANKPFQQRPLGRMRKIPDVSVRSLRSRSVWQSEMRHQSQQEWWEMNGSPRGIGEASSGRVTAWESQGTEGLL